MSMDRRPHSRTIDRILGSRGVVHSEKTDEYRAYIESGGRPQMGFSLHHADGTMDGFLYHNLDNIRIETKREVDYLCFDHRGKVVTLRGRGLAALFRAIMGHTLMEAYEFDGRPIEDDAALIDRMAVSSLSPPPEGVMQEH